MNRNKSNPNPNNNNGNNNKEWNGWDTAGLVAGVVGGVAALAGGIYLLSKRERLEECSPSVNTSCPTPTLAGNRTYHRSEQFRRSSSDSESSNSRPSHHLTDLMERINFESGSSRRGMPRSSIPDDPSLNNLDGLLDDIYKRYIAFNDEDFEMYYNVVHNIFHQLHNKMKEVDPYYNKYSSTVQFAGSHPDKLRINKPDEFDIDIVIGLPLSIKTNPYCSEESDIILEPKDPGFVQLKVGVQFENLPNRDGLEWLNNKAAYAWRDDRNYLCRSKFMDWFKSVVNRALNEFVENVTLPPIFYVAGVPYIVRRSESGPAMTMYIENQSKNFKLDVDLVPAFRFPIARWPISTSYRSVPPVCEGKDYWLVVPKPMKGAATEQDRARSWRVALHEQEGRLLHNTNHMRQAIRYIKKLRDAQNMNEIASYYIKTMFFWEAMDHQNDREFWNQRPSFIFKLMLGRFYDYLAAGQIPYFWNKKNNLVGHVNKATLNRYAGIVRKVLDVLEEPSQYKMVAKYLLTDAEFREYNNNHLHI